MIIDYEKLKELGKEKGLNILEALYLEDGVLGRFYPPNIILIDPNLCETQHYEKQKKVLVLLHEICHWFKWKENHLPNEEACFEFENICDFILNMEIYGDYEAIKRLNLKEPMKFLNEVIEKCVVVD